MESLFFGTRILTNKLKVYQEVYGSFGLFYANDFTEKAYYDALESILKVKDNTKKEIPANILAKCSYKKSAKQIKKLLDNLEQ
ncbi:MAG: hypothetical protein ACPGDB_05020 [Fusobacterium sp.]